MNGCQTNTMVINSTMMISNVLMLSSAIVLFGLEEIKRTFQNRKKTTYK